MTNKKIRILLADDQELIRKGLTIILNHQPDLEVVGQASDGAEVIQQARALRPDVILMDLKMPNVNGIQATRQILSTQSRVQIIVLTTYDTDDWVFDAIRAGAVGYLLKDATTDTLAEAVRSVMRGESQIDPAVARRVLREFQHLTPQRADEPEPEAPPAEMVLEELTGREEEVLQLLAEGLSNKDIATQLVLSEGTVKNHISAILSKLHANDRTQAVVTALKRGLVDL
jgi:DNA-binding NarL/FixJ family response regulator